MRILPRLRLLSAIALGGLVALGCFLGWSLLEFQAATANNRSLVAIRTNVFDASSLRDQYFLYRDERSRKQWDAKRQDVAELLAGAEAQFGDPDERHVFADLRRNLEESANIFLRIVANSKALQAAGPARASYEELDKRLLSQLLVKTAVSHDSTNALLESGERRVARAYRRLLVSIALGALVFVLTTVSTLFLVTRLIRARLASLHAGATIVASGRLDYRLDCQGSDELAEVAQSINSMTEKLQLGAAQLENDLAERERTLAALAREEEKFHTVADYTYDWEYWEGADHRIVFMSPSCERVTGYRPSEFEADPGLLLRIVHPDDQQPMQASRLAAVADVDYLDFRILRRDGEVRWIAHGSRPVVGRGGQFMGWRVSNRDITERKEMEERLRKAKESAEAANVAKSRFLATMSHEIRTPLNGILGMAQLLQLPGLDQVERQDYAGVILNSGETLLNLLNDILDLSKIEAGRVELEAQVFEPASMLREAAALFAEPAQAKGLKIDVVWHGAPAVRYRADANRLQQMLSNLVSNAIKFTAQGGVRIEGRESAVLADEVELEFAVTDTGIGIPADKQTLLFKPFSQVDASMTRAYGGTGLGLSIVRNLAKLMGGDVGVDSEAGKGARIWFRIRAGRIDGDEASRDADREVAEPRLAAIPSAAARSVLLVEDDATNRRVIEAMLSKFGIACECVGNGREAVERIAAGASPDVVLMDCHMPVMDGYEATERIRQWEAEVGKRRLPIIALTAGAFDENRQRCLAAGMDHFLTKPIDIGNLKTTLESYLSGA